MALADLALGLRVDKFGQEPVLRGVWYSDSSLTALDFWGFGLGAVEFALPGVLVKIHCLDSVTNSGFEIGGSRFERTKSVRCIKEKYRGCEEENIVQLAVALWGLGWR